MIAEKRKLFFSFHNLPEMSTEQQQVQPLAWTMSSLGCSLIAAIVCHPGLSATRGICMQQQTRLLITLASLDLCSGRQWKIFFCLVRSYQSLG